MERSEPAGLQVTPPLDDEVMVALQGLILALEVNIDLARRSEARARYVMDQRRRGRSYRDIVSTHGEQLIVEMMRENLTRLGMAASQLQHAQGKALYEEGMTMDEIGRLFGVSHQRVSAMLKRARADARLTT